MYFPIFVFLSEFYAGARGLSLAAIGALFIAVRLFDALSDPLVGILSDRYGARFGRRKFWIALALPVLVVATWALFVPPEDVGPLYLGGWLLAATFGWTLAMVPYFSWGAELSGRYAERSRVTIWREAMGLIGTIFAALLYSAGTAEEGLRLVALFVVIAAPVAGLMCLLRVPEPKDYSAAPPRLGDVWTSLAQERVMRRLLIAFFINGAANGIAATLFIFFVNYRLEEEGLGGPLLVLYFLSAVLATPLWSWLSGRYSKHRVWSFAMIYAGLVFVWTLALGPGDWIGFAVICVLSGAALGADLALPASIQADVVDVATARTGVQQTGAYFALWSLATKIALALAAGLSFLYLDIVGFVVGPGNGSEALLGLALLYGGGPIALKLIAVRLMWRFPVDAAEQERLRAVIERAATGARRL